MKIFESIQSNNQTTSSSPVRNIVDNDLPLAEKLATLRDSISTVKLTPNGENELLKLLFTGLGGKIYFPRKGDNSERFDATVLFDDYKVVTEVEIPSTAILDAPRNLLDDYAVIHSRKGEDTNNIIPLVICWDLPNKRTDYWNVITDINSILNIKIKTISILALAFYYWTKTPLDLLSDTFYLDHSDPMMHSTSELMKAYGISSDDYPGYFTPYK